MCAPKNVHCSLVSGCTFSRVDDVTATKEKGGANVFCPIEEHATAVQIIVAQ